MNQANPISSRIDIQLIPVRDCDGGVTLYADGRVAFYVHGGELFEAVQGSQQWLESNSDFFDFKNIMLMSTDSVSTS